MDGRQFDDLTRAFAQRTSRRAVVAGLAAGIAGALIGLGGRGTAAQRRVRQASGAACTRATECASFHCVDGFCCDASCTGQCEACNVPGREGVCTPVAGAPVGGRPACPGSGPCAATCDGVTGTLCTAYPGAETTCGAPTCADGWLTTSVCGGNGSCVPTTSSCAPFGCDATGTACATGCASDDDCEPGLACASGACVPVQALGAPCTDHAECASGLCADSVCCIGDCGPCRVCNAPGNEGFCSPAPDGDPCNGGRCCGGGCVDVASDLEHCGRCDNSCAGAANGPPVCVDGTCAVECSPGFQRCTEDGPCVACCTSADCPAPTGPCEKAAICTDGVCGFVPADPGTPCGAASCRDGTATLAAACTGDSPVCPPGVTVQCGLFTCDADEVACRTTCENDGDAGCVDGAHCDGGVCVPNADLGTPCDEPSDCESGFCVDGVCCNTACAGQCEVCNRDGSVGICAPVPAGSAPAGGRPACTGSGTPCVGACDGTLRTACAYPDESTPCQGRTCVGDSVQEERFCDGAGACAPSTTTQLCLRYACQDGACLSSCGSDDHCQDAYLCDDGDCVLRKASGASCGDGSECLSGNCVDGVCCSEASCDGQCSRCDVPGSEGTCAVPVGQSCVAEDKCLGDPTCQPDGSCSSSATRFCEPIGCAAAATCNPDTGACEPAGDFLERGTVCGEPTLPCEDFRRCTGDSYECPGLGIVIPAAARFPCQGENSCAARFCDGTSYLCPDGDEPLPASTACGAANGCQDSPRCDGVSLECPDQGEPLPAGTVCGLGLNVCEDDPRCDGVSLECPDEGEPSPAGTVCRDAFFPCEEPVQCNGVSVFCPGVGQPKPAGTLCGDPFDSNLALCEQVQRCDGEHVTCPERGLPRPSTHLCRPARSFCDIEERCDGESLDCPPDEVRQERDPCGGGSCQSLTFCDGHSPFCPEPETLPNHTPCGTDFVDYCCDGTCESKNDRDHCGSCGNVCGSCEKCIEGVCRSDPDFAQLGEPCEGEIDPQPSCCGDLYCLRHLPLVPGMCVPPCKSEGEVCTVFGGDERPCCDGLYCQLISEGAGTCWPV